MGVPGEDDDALERRAQLAIAAVRTQQGLPLRPRHPAYWAGVGWMGVSILAWGVAITGVHAGWWGSEAVVLSVALHFVCLIGSARSNRAAVMRVLVPAKGMICPRCLFSLPHEVEEGVCTECGTRYDRTRVVRMWRTEYRLEGHLPSDEELGRRG